MKNKNTKFKKSNVSFLLQPFLGFSKKYILDCAFDEKIQSKWIPETGQAIIGSTGNIFVISSYHKTHEKLGGDKFFFGGGLCNRTGGCVMDETYSNVLNKDGLEYYYDNEAKIKTRDNCYYSSFDNFRWIPYPHQLKNK